MNRAVIKLELDKIKNLFLEKRINKSELVEVLNIKKDSGFEEIRDKALMGEKLKVNKLLSENEILNEEAFFYLNIINYRLVLLQEILKINKNNDEYKQTLENLKPPIFWKDKPTITQQLKKWNKKKLEQMILTIGETEILMKKNSHLRNDVVIKDLIINLTDKATSSF